jgi:hypothetical protein
MILAEQMTRVTAGGTGTAVD